MSYWNLLISRALYHHIICHHYYWLIHSLIRVIKLRTNNTIYALDNMDFDLVEFIYWRVFWQITLHLPYLIYTPNANIITKLLLTEHSWTEIFQLLQIYEFMYTQRQVRFIWVFVNICHNKANLENTVVTWSIPTFPYTHFRDVQKNLQIHLLSSNLQLNIFHTFRFHDTNLSNPELRSCQRHRHIVIDIQIQSQNT